MLRIKKIYIYQQNGWPDFNWDNEVVMPLLSRVRHLQGKITGRMEALGFELRDEAVLKTMTLDVIKTSEIEGEVLKPDQVRSSIARRLGMDVAGLVVSDRHVDGVVDMMLDATRNYNKPLTTKRLYGWHAAMFPAGRSGMYKILVGKFRDDSTGPMQVVSGALGKEKVHFQAPDAKLLKKEFTLFAEWFNRKDAQDDVIKAAVAHLWFVTLHPFEDGNGRMARAVTDMLLAKSDSYRTDNLTQRFYSMSAQIRIERKGYYDILEQTQKGGLDVTAWLVWFLNCLYNALQESEHVLGSVLFKHRFWNKHSAQILNDRQIRMINKLMDGFTGNLTSSKWAKINGCSADTALRDINDLVNKGVLEKDAAGGRSTNYSLVRDI